MHRPYELYERIDFMARKKAEPKKTAKPNNNAYIEGAGLVADEKITMSLDKN